MDPNAARKADLMALFPGWEVWTVHKALGGYVWCARREGAAVAEFNEDNSGELAHRLAEAGAKGLPGQT